MTTPSTTASPILSTSPVQKVTRRPRAASFGDAKRSSLEKPRYCEAPKMRRAVWMPTLKESAKVRLRTSCTRKRRKTRNQPSEEGASGMVRNSSSCLRTRLWGKNVAI